MSVGVKCFRFLGFGGVRSNGGVGSNGSGFVFIGGFVFVVNESLEIFYVSDLAGK